MPLIGCIESIHLCRKRRQFQDVRQNRRKIGHPTVQRPKHEFHNKFFFKELLAPMHQAQTEKRAWRTEYHLCHASDKKSWSASGKKADLWHSEYIFASNPYFSPLCGIQRKDKQHLYFQPVSRDFPPIPHLCVYDFSLDLFTLARAHIRGPRNADESTHFKPVWFDNWFESIEIGRREKIHIFQKLLRAIQSGPAVCLCDENVRVCV